MIPYEFFRASGLFLKEGFLRQQECSQITREMRETRHRPATASIEDVVREDVRKASLCDVSPEIVEPVRSKLESLMPELAKHFKTSLSSLQPLNFLEYVVGEHHVVHRDATPSPPYNTRRVSLSILLNDETEDAEDNSYHGGSLVFYDLSGLKDLGFPLSGKAGLLVAFASTIPHEVKPVLKGTRRSIVTWFV